MCLLFTSACCAALTELVLNDTNAQQMVQGNGIYFLGVLILPQEGATDKQKKAVETLQVTKHDFQTSYIFLLSKNICVIITVTIKNQKKSNKPTDLAEQWLDI